MELRLSTEEGIRRCAEIDKNPVIIEDEKIVCGRSISEEDAGPKFPYKFSSQIVRWDNYADHIRAIGEDGKTMFSVNLNWGDVLIWE